MKKIIVFSLIALSILVLLTSCQKEQENKPAESDEIDYSEYFLNPREEAELCYISVFDSGDFGSYIYSYPEAAIDYFASQRNMDTDTFIDECEKTCELIATDRIALYGEDFKVGYVSILDENIEGKELEQLKSDIAVYGIAPETVTKAFRGHYQYSLFNAPDPQPNEEGITEHNFGKIPEDAEILFTSTVVFTLIYIEDEGWYVSPLEFNEM